MPAPVHPDDCICNECHERDLEADRAVQIEYLVKKAQESTADAITAAGKAAKALAELTGQVYDIELAEGPEGSDALSDMAEASKRLRNVSRILDHRRSLLDEGH